MSGKLPEACPTTMMFGGCEAAIGEPDALHLECDSCKIEPRCVKVEIHAFGTELYMNTMDSIADTAKLVNKGLPSEDLKQAEEKLSRIEAMFPNWASFRDLEECIEVTLYQARNP